jgi:hypothetical protein
MMTTVALPPWREPRIMDDLVEMCRRSKTTDVAVMIMGIPECGAGREGVEQALEQFGRIKARLEPQGVRSGILIQTLIGHGERGRPIPTQPFQRIVGWDGTECRPCFCPLDEGFLEHARQVVRLMAQAAPAFLLVDDDTRLNNHHPARWSCACRLHVNYFNQATGRSLSRDDIFKAMRRGDEAANLIRDQWFESGEQSMLALAREVRKAIDTIDPTIRCGKCASGGRHELLQEPFARALAGRTRPLIRIAHATYGEQGYKQFGLLMAIHQMQRNLMGDAIEYMCEADTYPHTFYSTSRKAMRGFISGAILASKVDVPYTWIPSIREWVRPEWEGYADEMGRNEPFFRALRDLSRKTKRTGPGGVCLRAYNYVPNPADMPVREAAFDLAWAGLICGRFGIPFTVNDPAATAAMLDGTASRSLTPDEIRYYLSRGLLLDGPAALALAQRGFAEHLGVDVALPEASLEVSMEIPADDPVNGSAAGMHLATLMRHRTQAMRLTPRGARPVSWFVRNRWFMDPDFQQVAPALTLYENKLGGRVAVYAHDLPASASISFLNPIRKRQIIGVLEWLQRRPLEAVAMTPGDTYMLFGRNEMDGEDVAALFNLNPDTVEHGVELRLARGAPDSIQRLDDDGQWRAVAFEPAADGVRLKTPLETMMPLVVRMK